MSTGLRVYSTADGSTASASDHAAMRELYHPSPAATPDGYGTYQAQDLQVLGDLLYNRVLNEHQKETEDEAPVLDPCVWANELAWAGSDYDRRYLLLTYLRELVDRDYLDRDMLDEIIKHVAGQLAGSSLHPLMRGGTWVRFLGYLHAAYRERRSVWDLTRYLVTLYFSTGVE